MKIQRINLKTFESDFISVEQFLREPGVNKFYDALTTIKKLKRLVTENYAYFTGG